MRQDVGWRRHQTAREVRSHEAAVAQMARDGASSGCSAAFSVASVVPATLVLSCEPVDGAEVELCPTSTTNLPEASELSDKLLSACAGRCDSTCDIVSSQRVRSKGGRGRRDLERKGVRMLFAIKLLCTLAVLSYAVSSVLAEKGLCAAFQVPITRIISRYTGDRVSEDALTLNTVRTASAMYSKRPHVTSRQLQPQHRRPAFAEQLLDNSTIVITTVDGLRIRHGEASWWGDLNHVETRYVYHKLLPRKLLDLANERADVAVEDLARAASMARHAARIYARERSSLPLRLMAGLYDGFRHLKHHGRWSWTGMTYEELWAKYERKILEEMGVGSADDVDSAELNRRIALRILQKSCQTNPGFDRMGKVERAQEILQQRADQHRKRELWRRRARKSQAAVNVNVAAAAVDAVLCAASGTVNPLSTVEQSSPSAGATFKHTDDAQALFGSQASSVSRESGTRRHHLSGLLGLYFKKLGRASLPL